MCFFSYVVSLHVPDWKAIIIYLRSQLYLYESTDLNISREDKFRLGEFFLKINEKLCELLLYKPHVTYQHMLLVLQLFFHKKLKKQIVFVVHAPSTMLPLLLQAKARTRTTQVKRGSSHRGTMSVPPFSP